MATRDEVRHLLERGHDHVSAAERLGITPGEAYLVATGMAADGSDTPDDDVRRRPGWLASSQHLANSQPAENPTTSDTVLWWMRNRAVTDPAMQHAARVRREDG